MPALIDMMADGQELRAFAQRLNAVVPPEQAGSSAVLTANQRGSARRTAFEGVADPGNPEAPSTAPEARKGARTAGVERAKATEQDQ